MQFMAFLLPQITNMCISGELHYDCTKWSLNRGQINLSAMVWLSLVLSEITRTPKPNRWSRRLGQGSSGWALPTGFTMQATLPCLSRCLPSARGTREHWTQREGLSYIICYFKNLICRQILKRSQLNTHSNMKATPGRWWTHSMRRRRCFLGTGS